MKNFLIADSFTDSLAKLTGDEQKAVKTTAFDLQLSPKHPSMSLHKIEESKDRHFWSVRVNSDIRLIVHRTSTSLLLCYVDHHDKAYQWAARRKLETHPKTGAAQWVEIRERVEETRVSPEHAQTPHHTNAQARSSAPPAPPPLFSRISDEKLLSYGVPPEWLADVRQVDEEGLLTLAGHLPAEAAEALLELATGGTPQPVPSTQADNDPFSHPDAQRRFRVMKDVEELERALNAPWEKWTVFLHPSQRQWVERDYTGPARISGSAGTGKTIVALHRAVHLTRQHPDSRVLLTTLPHTHFDFVVVDEAQDVSIAQLQFLAAMSSSQGQVRPNSLFFTGDLGQRIFQQPFSWKFLGIDVRGRSRTLQINYRTSHQIRARADQLLAPSVADVDGHIEDRSGTVSLFNGPTPEIYSFKSEAEERKAVTAWLRQRIQEGVVPHELGIFVRSEAQMPRARAAVTDAGVPFGVLDEHVEILHGQACVCTMHLAKGLEFRAVVVMACDDEVMPLQERIEAVTDDADIEEVYHTERHLLYVACTRARDRLLVTSTTPASEFLQDLCQR